MFFWSASRQAFSRGPLSFPAAPFRASIFLSRPSHQNPRHRLSSLLSKHPQLRTSSFPVTPLFQPLARVQVNSFGSSTYSHVGWGSPVPRRFTFVQSARPPCPAIFPPPSAHALRALRLCVRSLFGSRAAEYGLSRLSHSTPPHILGGAFPSNVKLQRGPCE